MKQPQFIQIQNLSFEDFWNKITEIVELVVTKHTSKQQNQTTNEEYLNRNQAAALLLISPPTLDKYQLEGKISSYKISGKKYGRKLFKKSEIIDFINKNKS